MKIAARWLQRGDSVLRAAEHVGYNSQAAFTRAFKRVDRRATRCLPARPPQPGRPTSAIRRSSKTATPVHRAARWLGRMVPSSSTEEIPMTRLTGSHADSAPEGSRGLHRHRHHQQRLPA